MIILIETFNGLDSGIRIGGETYTDEGYADDVGLMTNSIAEMNIVLDRLFKNARRYG